MATQLERSATTRANLLAAARRLFATKGYAATSVEMIVKRARLTKGAFYHHFRDKQAVFRDVLEAEVSHNVALAASRARGANPVARFRSAFFAYLDVILDSEVQRIVLDDGPAVLGWQAWRELDWKYGLSAIERGLHAAIAEGHALDRPIKTLAHLLFAAVCESAMVVARSPTPRAALRDVRSELDRMLTALLRRTN